MRTIHAQIAAADATLKAAVEAGNDDLAFVAWRELSRLQALLKPTLH